MSEPVPLLQLVGLRKRYQDVEAVRGISFSLQKGALLTLLGPSGCGKSTLLRMVAGFVTPTQGDILVNGRSVVALRPERRPTAMVFQSYALFPHMSVEDNVAFGLTLRRLPRAEIRRRVGEALSLVRMSEMARRFPSELSGGQQQRTALARCLVIEPDILLLDEPFGALDRHLRDQMQIELRKLQKQLGITMLVVTHDQQEALVLSDYVAVMNAGALAQFDPPAALYDRPTSRFVASFMGMSNILDGRVEVQDGRPEFRISSGGHVPLAPHEIGRATDSRYVAVRPENLRIVEPGGPEACLCGTVAFASLVGSNTVYEVHTEVTTLSVVVPRSQAGFGVGSRVGISVDPDHAVLLSA